MTFLTAKTVWMSSCVVAGALAQVVHNVVTGMW